jgi:two-component system alkaline phosphatase synthesis response regulator PhoP
MTDPSGAVSGRIFAFRDISDERVVEQMKTEFVATVSHELRTPLTSIYGFAETLLREDVQFADEERRTFLRYIASESERLTTIVDTLLSVARLEAGDVRCGWRRPTSPRSSPRPSQRSRRRWRRRPPLRRRGARRRRSTRRRTATSCARCSGSCSTTPSATRRPGGPVHASARVRRTGRGARRGRGNRDPPREIEHIFRKFYRGEAGTRVVGTATPGSALHRRGLVTAMGGRIAVDSRRARLDLRASSCRARGLRPRRAGIGARTYARDRLTPMTKVLIIDDEAPIRLLCRVNLEAEGMDVVEAGDGPSGLDLARAELPDVVLLDVMMPGLDGWAVAQELLEDVHTDAIPIVFLTARAEFRDRARGLDIGGVDYITKPFNPVELAPLVRRLLSRLDRGERDDLRREKLAELRALVDETA